MSNDAWLHAMRRDPSPEFKEQLRKRLRAEEPVVQTRREWPRRMLATAATVVVLAGLMSVPSVRAAAAHFVSLFRVVNFVAVPVDPTRLDKLRAENLEIGTLIGEHVEVLQESGAPQPMPTIEQASAAAGMPLAQPQWLPDDTKVIEMAVVGARAVRVTASSTRLQQVMDALGINDLTAPAGLDGQTVDIRVPPVAMIRYEHGTRLPRRTRLFQAQSPQVALPDGINMQALGEIGLRILGQSPQDAKAFAQTLDWNSTLIFPVPPTASSFRQVTVNGHQGVMIEHQPKDSSPTTAIVWSTADRVFALVSILGSEQALAMADSVR